MSLAALDPGSSKAAVAINGTARTIAVDSADVGPAVDEIDALLVVEGARELVIEWGPFFLPKSASDAAKMAMVRNREVMVRLCDRIEQRCAARGIAVHRMPRATWCRYIGAEAERDPETGFSLGVTDRSVRAALARLLGAESPDATIRAGAEAMLASLRDAHQRDAVGLLLGWQRAEAARVARETARAAETGMPRPRAPRERKPTAEIGYVSETRVDRVEAVIREHGRPILAGVLRARLGHAVPHVKLMAGRVVLLRRGVYALPGMTETWAYQGLASL